MYSHHMPERPVWFTILAVAMAALLFLSGTVPQAGAQGTIGQLPSSQVIASPPVQPGVFDGDVRTLPKASPWKPGQPIQEMPTGLLKEPPPPVERFDDKQPDPVLQARWPAAVTPPEFLNPNPNFDGTGFTGTVPPDTNGDVGPNHFVQMVNSQFQIFDKQGNSLAGPTNINQLWINANSGTACQTRNDGDPIVLYDHLADRWVMSQFAIPNGFNNPPTFECIAVSQTADPVTGGWYLYEFQFTFNHDYPKLSVWPDAYYLTSQQGYSGGDLNILAIDRANMLNGNPATFQATTLSGPAIILLPSDVDGTPPPTGSPAFFARPMDGALWGGSDRLEVYQFQVDWGNPANSAFTGPTTLTPAPFDATLCSGASLQAYCIPQPGTTQQLDSLTAWPMFRLQYRNFGTYEAMVFNHTVNADGAGDAGIRWYELRRTPPGSGAWTLYQQGTFAPQQAGATVWLHRWMGSIAMDKAGNIALGYSVSDSNATFPGARYAGRFATDPLGLLPQGEGTLMNGTGSQILFCGGNPCPRWGDYSDMTVDPVDNCTFWYTTEYGNAGNSWSTRIGAFRFPTCNPADVAIAKTASPDPVNAGALLIYHLTASNLGPNPATDVVVEDTLPAGVTYVADTGGCTLSAGVLTCDLGTLAAGASRSFAIQVQVDSGLVAGGTHTLTNAAAVSATEFDPATSNNNVTVTTFVNESADLRVSKTCKPDTPVQAGVEAMCTIVVENLGTSDARDVSLVDNHVSNGTFTFGTVTTSLGTCTTTPNPQVNTGTVDCNLGTLAAGDSATIVVPVSATEPQTINDQATASSATPDPDPANNQAQGRVRVGGASDLAITKSASPDPVTAGTNLTYDLMVSNAGPSDAPNVVVSDMLPAGVSIVSVSASGGTCNAGVPGDPARPTVCTFDTLAMGASGTMQIVVTVLPPTTGILHNDASVSSDSPDPDNSNNLATTDTTVEGQADLVVTKVDHPDPVVVGQMLTYEITIADNGPSTARTVTLLDQLPPEVAFIGATISHGSGTCVFQTVPPNSVFCNLNNLDPGQYVKVFIDTLVNPSVPDGTQILNTATAAAATSDPDLTNNTATATTTVQAEADLSIAKDAQVDLSNPAPRIMYTVDVTNLGPSDAQNVVMTDPLPLDPKKIRFLFDTGNGTCTYVLATHTVTCDVGTLAAGATYSVDIYVDVRGSVGVISNIASVTSSTADPNPANNSARKDVRIKGGPGPTSAF
jgi:uncharacterized repeat protein (TIGR01451 family)